LGNKDYFILRRNSNSKFHIYYRDIYNRNSHTLCNLLSSLGPFLNLKDYEKENNILVLADLIEENPQICITCLKRFYKMFTDFLDFKKLYFSKFGEAINTTEEEIEFWKLHKMYREKNNEVCELKNKIKKLEETALQVFVNNKDHKNIKFLEID